ncbi:MAG: hypothetical protein HY913_01345 [Desulfomonile tiedjei]|nr:hypothetical protein [Desulfomonile tiedjei]
MKNGLIRFLVGFVPASLIAVALCTAAWATIPDGFKDVKLGMKKAQVLDILQKGSGHFSYDDLGTEIGEIIRNDDLFRYATYRFNSDGMLIEIGLEMREILGKDRVLEQYGTQHGVKLSPMEPAVDSDRIIEVRDNSLVLKKGGEAKTRSAKGGN